MTQYILSIDQGTTSSRAILFNLDGSIHASSQQEFTQRFPASGWVEHNPEDIWRTVRETCDDVMKKGCGENGKVVAVGKTNQRETTVLWDRATGEAVYPAIVWQDRRTAEWCEVLKKQSLELSVSNKTGLLIDPYFSATKIRWVLDHVSGARQRAHKGELALCFGGAFRAPVPPSGIRYGCGCYAQAGAGGRYDPGSLRRRDPGRTGAGPDHDGD